MKQSRFILLYAALATACGVVVGNPDNTEDEEQNFIPEIDYSMPESVSGYSLVQYSLAPGDDILSRWAHRTDRTIDKINQILRRLNRDQVRSSGSFSGKGPDGGISGTIDASGLEGFDYQATLCYDDEPFQTVSWSSDGTQIYALRNLATDPSGQNDDAEALVEVRYRDTSSKQVDLFFQGEPWFVPAAVEDGDQLSEMISSTLSGNEYSFSGVNNWYEDEPDQDADGYLVGTFNGEGDGEFVGYREFDPRCETFDEANAQLPGWCLGKALGGEAFDDTERDDAWERLQAIGITSAASLRQLALPASLSCP